MLSSFLDSIKSLRQLICNEMATLSQNPTKFIEDALFFSGPLALSYSDHDQKWIIRHDLISLFQDFPFLKPSIGFFTHNDGTEAKLLSANGELPVSKLAPPVPLTIWVHELYPQMAPIVYVNVGSSMYPIYENHPFVDSSGATSTTYLANWQFPRCNLSGLVRNLTKLFSHNHPFYYTDSWSCSHPSMASKTEAMDRLVCTLYYDVEAIRAKTQEEIENLAALQVKLQKRAEDVKIMMSGLEQERKSLKGRTEAVCGESDKLLNWLKAHGSGPGFPIDDAFAASDRKSEIKLECSAADSAAEDLMYALDKAVEERAVDFQVYTKQVRALAREQFMHRAKVMKILRPNGFLFV